jgi:hypothetical protein
VGRIGIILGRSRQKQKFGNFVDPKSGQPRISDYQKQMMEQENPEFAPLSANSLNY